MPARRSDLVERTPAGRARRVKDIDLRRFNGATKDGSNQAARAAGHQRRNKDENVMSVVLAQPHRMGDSDQRCASAIGRFCMRKKLRSELYDAALDYAALKRRWLIAVGRPRGFENTSGGGGGEGPSEDTVRGWLRQIVSIETKLQLSERGALKYHLLVKTAIDDVDPPEDPISDAVLTSALRELAVLMGRVSGRESAFR